MPPKIFRPGVFDPASRAQFTKLLPKVPTFSRNAIINRLKVLANLSLQELLRLAPEGVFPLIILTKNFKAASPTLPKIIKSHQRTSESELDRLAVNDIDNFAWLIAQEQRNNFTYKQLVGINERARTNRLGQNRERK